MANEKSANKTQIVMELLGLLLISLGFIVLLGWVLKSAPLVQIMPNMVPMQFNTALCFTLAGLSICTDRLNNRYYQVAIATTIIIISGLSCAEYLLDKNLGIDTLFIEPFLSVKTIHPGRMAPNTGFCFILFSIFIYFTLIKNSRFLPFLMLLPCVFGVLGLISLFGYILQVEQAYTWGTLTHMAIHSASGFVLLSMASLLLFVSKFQTYQKPTSYLLDYVGFASCLLFFLILWQVLRINSINNLKNEAENQIQIVKANLTIESKKDIQAINRLFIRYHSQSYSNPEAFERDVRSYFDDIRALETIRFNTEKDGPVTHISPHLSSEEISHVKTCDIVTTATTSKLVLKIENHSSILCMANGSASASINLKTLFSKLIPFNAGNFNITLKRNGNTIFQNKSGDIKHKKFWATSEVINLYGVPWDITIYPSNHYIQQTIARIPALILFLGGFISFLVLFLLRYRRRFIAQERSLLSAEVIKTTVLNSTIEGILGVNHSLNVNFMNASAQKLLDVPFEESKNLTVNALTQNSQAVNTGNVINTIKKTLHDGTSSTENSEVFFKENGTPLPIRYSSSPIVENNVITGALIVFSDNTERLAHEAKLQNLALYDNLTKLPNRFCIMSHLKECITRAQRHKHNFSVCFIDVDKFKAINDNYGHHIGDMTLQYVGNLISSVTRQNDFLGRLSGDEFCLILDGVTARADIDAIVEKIHRCFHRPMIANNQSVQISLSIGVVPYMNEATPEELLIKADDAMYKVKKSGGLSTMQGR